MLTFKKVMEVFKDYLTTDTRYEIVITSHGYIVLEWDSVAKAWAGEELRSTPEIMRDILLDDFAGYMEYKILIADGEIDGSAKARIAAQRQAFWEKLQ